MGMRFFIFFEALKFNFVVLTKDVNKKNALALIAVEILMSLFFSNETHKIETDSRIKLLKKRNIL